MNEHEGHRKRLRTKLLNSGLSGFLDYEIIELLLTIGIPRKDCKPLAKELIKKFKTVNGVIHADDNDLKQFKGIGETSIFAIKLMREMMIYAQNESLSGLAGDNISVRDVADLAIKEIGFLKKEVFKVYCISTKGFVISSVVSIGAIDASIVHPRELFKIAIENSASSIVVVHNHPSGDITPSDDDILTTRRLAEAGKILSISLDDHIIVSSTGYTSMEKEGYI
ncbi:DNA repair protein RadC [Candidatus Saccharibacteria bacterium]|nr:DNA repair protein RadC [Candidatus Saccharibacteria bacterium]